MRSAAMAEPVDIPINLLNMEQLFDRWKIAIHPRTALSKVIWKNGREKMMRLVLKPSDRRKCNEKDALFANINVWLCVLLPSAKSSLGQWTKLVGVYMQYRSRTNSFLETVGCTRYVCRRDKHVQT